MVSIPAKPKLVLIWRLRTPCMHKDSMERFITHIMRLCRENRAGTQASLGWPEQRDGWWLGLGGRVPVRVPGRAPSLWALNFPTDIKRRSTWAFLLTFSDEGKRKGPGVRPESFVFKHPKWREALYYDRSKWKSIFHKKFLKGIKNIYEVKNQVHYGDLWILKNILT